MIEWKLIEQEIVQPLIPPAKRIDLDYVRLMA